MVFLFECLLEGRTRIPLHTMTCVYMHIYSFTFLRSPVKKMARCWKGFWSSRFPGTHPFSMERLRMVMELKYITEEVIGQPNHSLTMRGHVCLAVASTTFYIFPQKKQILDVKSCKPRESTSYDDMLRPFFIHLSPFRTPVVFSFVSSGFDVLPEPTSTAFALGWICRHSGESSL